ncbi:MAG: ABC transporter permease, partial [Candidatus Hodarchaeales archaeon]
AVSRWQSLNMEKMLLLSFTRGFVQLVLVASILVMVFSLEDLFLIFVVLIIMSLLAAHSSSQRFPKLPNILFIQSMAIILGSITVLGVSSLEVLSP